MSSKFSRILAWIEHLLHLDKHGQLPDPPSVTGAPVVVPVLPPVATPAPVPEPVPVPVPVPAPEPPAPSPAPVPVSEYDANGRKLNPNGSVSYQKIDNLVQSGAWPKETAKAFVSQTPYKDGTALTDQQKLFISFNTADAYGHVVAAQDYHLDGTGLFNAYEVTPNPLGNGTQGAELMDTLAFPNDNVIAGHVEFKGFEDSDLDTFIANCERTKNFPIIKHSSGPVAQ